MLRGAVRHLQGMSSSARIALLVEELKRSDARQATIIGFLSKNSLASIGENP
jgi:hypothetical protein